MNDPGLEERRQTGRRIILVGGCLVPIAFVLFLAVWQFLSPAERPVPTHGTPASSETPWPSSDSAVIP